VEAFARLVAFSGELSALLVTERGLEQGYDAQRIEHHVARALAFAVMPSTQFTRRLLTARSIVAIEAKSAKVITGSMTFSCNCPAEAQGSR